MKKAFIIILLIFLIFGCSNEQDNDNISANIVNNPITADNDNTDMGDLPTFEFKEIEHDFGVIIQGEKVSYTYKFKNVGGSDLILSSVRATCGCTIPKYDREPIATGKEGKIEVIFDSSGRNGKQHKTIMVLANTQPNKIELSFTAEIIVPE